jgi:integral membrane protein
MDYNMMKAFRIIALLEGISYILLLFVGIPMKYMMDNPTMVKAMGMPHGVLFMAYLFLAISLKTQQRWKFGEFMVILAASILPFGTFYVDKKYLKQA